MADTKREIYQRNLEMEMLTEGRLAPKEWEHRADFAARAYAKARTDPHAYWICYSRIQEKIFSIAEALRAAKEGWEL